MWMKRKMSHIEKWLDYKGGGFSLVPQPPWAHVTRSTLRTGLPQGKEQPEALTGAVLPGTWRESVAIADAEAKLLRPSCWEMFQATHWQSSSKPSGWCFPALPNLQTEQIRPPGLLTMPCTMLLPIPALNSAKTTLPNKPLTWPDLEISQLFLRDIDFILVPKALQALNIHTNTQGHSILQLRDF